MQADYSVDVCRTLQKRFGDARLHRPMQVARYDAGTELAYDVTPVAGPSDAGSPRVHLFVEKFVGGGFAGQVYRVRVTGVEGGSVPGIEADRVYALKILKPPSRLSLFFRNLLYAIGFQGSFQLQTNPVAARSGALWQKFIRRAARGRFGNDGAVNNIHATFVDHDLGSCGELSDWVAGRTWRLEVDDRLDLLGRWRSGKTVEPQRLGSPEYRAKKQFMQEFVELLGELGAPEFARQYEWTTCKSQPNCLKRLDTEDDPSGGLVAVDFRAGLALLPFLPMSPGDFKLIAKGLLRGSLVQFDRGDVDKLAAFVQRHEADFDGMLDSLDQLRSDERTYRNSIPDLTHNHLRLLYSRELWGTMRSAAITGWKVRGLIDERGEETLRRSRLLTAVSWLAGLVPLLGRVFRKFNWHSAWRKHYVSLLSSPGYLGRAIRGKMAEKTLSWYRAGRLSESAALRVSQSFPRFLLHLPLSILPVGIYKFLTSWTYAKERLHYILVRPIRLYFDQDLREKWLREMVSDGQAKQIINDAEADVILSRIKEPFIQKYLKSLAVHVCTLPVTQVISVLVAVLYVAMHPDLPRTQAWAVGIGIVALFQVTPISPGSLVRGFYVLYLVIRERNFKDYNIAVFLGFFKYIGYLSFPIQMTYRYPELARFMAGHWATETVHIVPVFGERGALLERWVFCLFYNWPLTIGRRMRKRFARRAETQPRYWHVVPCAIAAAAMAGVVVSLEIRGTGELPGLKQIWWFLALMPLICGMVVTLGARGANMWGRILAAVGCGVLAGVLSTVVMAVLAGRAGLSIPVDQLVTLGAWQVFVFALLSPLGAILTELKIPDPDLK